jgi:hypothetical protein
MDFSRSSKTHAAPTQPKWVFLNGSFRMRQSAPEVIDYDQTLTQNGGEIKDFKP